jgi:hypothetical protein
MEQNANPFTNYMNLLRGLNNINQNQRIHSTGRNHSTRRTNSTGRANSNTTNRGQEYSERELNILNEISYEYNRNIREYNENMREIIFGILNNSMRNFNERQSNPSHNTPRNTNPGFDISMNMSFWEFPLNVPPEPEVRRNLTREEISRSTRTYGFTEDMNAGLTDINRNVCPISLEPFQPGDVICEIRGCGHKFKRPLLMNWFRRNSKCPVCRFDVRTNLPSPDTDPQQEATLSEHEDIGIISNDELQTSLSEMLQSFINNAVETSLEEPEPEHET